MIGRMCTGLAFPAPCFAPAAAQPVQMSADTFSATRYWIMRRYRTRAGQASCRVTVGAPLVYGKPRQRRI